MELGRALGAVPCTMNRETYQAIVEAKGSEAGAESIMLAAVMMGKLINLLFPLQSQAFSCIVLASAFFIFLFMLLTRMRVFLFFSELLYCLPFCFSFLSFLQGGFVELWTLSGWTWRKRLSKKLESF